MTMRSHELILSTVLLVSYFYKPGFAQWTKDKVVDGISFTYGEKHMTWEEALEDCVSREGTLATISSETLLQNVRSAFNISDDYWIGANDKANEGQFVWAEDGSSAYIINSWWSPGAKKSVTLDCIAVTAGNKVYDSSCVKGDAARDYLCMQPNSATSDPTTASTKSTATEDTTTLAASITISTITQPALHLETTTHNLAVTKTSNVFSLSYVLILISL